MIDQELVWYACYGSNLSREKLIARYISRCSDRQPPTRDLPYILPHSLYFAGSSSKWGGQGVAFVQNRRDEKVKTFGRAYLISKEQLEEIQKMEGPAAHWYGSMLKLGSLEGHTVYTLTREENFDAFKPGLPAKEYLQVIKKGLAQAWPKVNAKAYLDTVMTHTRELITAAKGPAV